MRAFWQNTIAILVSTVLGLTVVEFGLRWLETESYFLPARVNEEGYAVHIPNLDQEKFDNENKKKIHIKTNELGFVGDEFVPEKSTSTLRLAFTGDSFAEAMQVDYQDTTAVLLAQKLNDYLKTTTTPYTNVEVYNFGVGGSGTVDQLLQYAHYIRTFKPNIVVWNFYSGNDVADNGRYVAQAQDIITKNLSELAQHPQIVAAQSNLWQDRIYRSSAIVRLIDKFFRSQPSLFALGVKAGVFTAKGPVSATIPEAHLYYVPSSGDHRAAAHQLTAAILPRAKQLVEAEGVKFVPVYIPEGQMIHPVLGADLVTQYTAKSEHGFATNTQYQYWVATSSPVLPWLDLTPELSRRIATGERLYLQDIGHLNEAGHRVVTDILFNHILSLL